MTPMLTHSNTQSPLSLAYIRRIAINSHKFTMEMGGDGDYLNFLDLTIIKKDNSLIFNWFCNPTSSGNWFRKPTSSGRFLSFYSHPFNHKRGTMYSLIDRVIRLSHPEFQKNNFDYIIKVLLDNGYPLDLIFSTIRKRLHTAFHGTLSSTQKTEGKINQLFHHSICFLYC